MSRFAAAVVSALADTVCDVGRGAAGADYPARTVTLVVPYPPGGGVDAMARVVAEKLSAALASNSSSTTGPAPAARSAPARSRRRRPTATRCCSATPARSRSTPASTPMPATIRARILRRSGWSPRCRWRCSRIRRFRQNRSPTSLRMAKKDPGKLNLGTSAVGTGGYMCAELFKSEAGVDVAIIPYKGTAPVMNDLLGGHVPVAFGVLPPALGNLQAGKLRAIAVTSKKRFSLLPDVPTFDESGLPGFEAVLHYGLLAPAGTPKAIVDRLSEELRKLVDTPEVQKQIHNEGGDPLTSTPGRIRRRYR